MKYRKKPVEFEATQWFKNGDHPLDYSKDAQGFEAGELRTFTAGERREKSWEGDVVRYYRRPDVPGEKLCIACGIRMHEHGWIDQPFPAGYTVCPGDFVITVPDGSYRPCNPGTFAAEYEPGPVPQ
jgi:hypothetical protein